MKPLDESALRARVDMALNKMCFVLLDPVDRDEVDLGALERHVSIGFEGDEGSGRVWLSAADEFVLEVASGLLGLDSDEIDSESEGVGALLELANVLCGEVVQLLEYERRVHQSFQPLGRILLDMKAITVKEVAAIVQLQLAEEHLQFGQLAIREGFCTTQEIQAALDFQHRHCPHVLELALADDRVDQEKLRRHLVEYVRHAEHLLGCAAEAPLST